MTWKLYVTEIFDNALVAICKSKVTLTLNNPAHVGMFALDLSKVLMYQFHYDYIKIKYSNNSRQFTDTDSLMYEIKPEDVYEDFDTDIDSLMYEIKPEDVYEDFSKDN